VKRWQEFTGQSATLEGDGRTFADMEGLRRGSGTTALRADTRAA